MKAKHGRVLNLPFSPWFCSTTHRLLTGEITINVYRPDPRSPRRPYLTGDLDGKQVKSQEEADRLLLDHGYVRPSQRFHRRSKYWWEQMQREKAGTSARPS